jgi:two-component system, LytTR family, response regulator
MMHCIIVDDEQHAVDYLSRLVEQTPGLELAGSFSNPLEALKAIGEKKPELVFLDIQMPHISGLEMIAGIYANGVSRVILCSGYMEYAIQGFEHDVVDYLMKPFGYARFLKAVQKAQAMIGNAAPEEMISTVADDSIFARTEHKGKLIRISLEQVDYIERINNYVNFYMGSDKIMALFSLKELEERLPPKRFARIHNSFIIQLDRISTVEGNRVVLKTGKEVPIGITYKDAFFELIGAGR